MKTTTVGLFDSKTEAEEAKSRLITAGISRSAIDISGGNTESSRIESGPQEEKGLLDKLKEFFGSSPDYSKDSDYWQEGLRRGNTVVAVTTDDEMQSTVEDILEECGARDVDQKAQEWRAAGWSGPAESANEAESGESDVAIPVIEEELRVGKRQRPKGSVRVYSHMEETPVEETVNLVDETVRVDRESVDRPAMAADLDAFKEGTVEFMETTEEPVVAKQARVIEEVKVSKEGQSREERIQDTVRKTRVDIEGSETSAADSEERYRENLNTQFGRRSESSDDEYAPAYRFGSSYASDSRYQGRDWDDVEPDVRRDWETQGSGTWESFRDAIRQGWESARGRRAA